MNINKGK